MRGLRELARLAAEASAQLVRKRLGDDEESHHARRQRLEGVLADEVAEWATGRLSPPERAPLLTFCGEFRACWERNSLHTFTRGMTMTGGHTKSNAVDALHILARRLDQKLPRSRVVTAVRNLTTGRRDPD